MSTFFALLVVGVFMGLCGSLLAILLICAIYPVMLLIEGLRECLAVCRDKRRAASQAIAVSWR
jgi:hypothetical protein